MTNNPKMGTINFVPSMGTKEKQVKEKPKSSTDVRFRLTNELHEPLKDMAKKEQRSMNYLMNKAVELLIKQESAKA